MRKMRLMSVLLPALLLAVFAAPKSAVAETEVFRVKAISEARVQIVFFSKDRHIRWPATDRAFDLNDFNEHDFKLACVNGEQICYGAWVAGNGKRFWGVGADGKAGCANCCYTCEGKNTREVVLRNPIDR